MDPNVLRSQSVWLAALLISLLLTGVGRAAATQLPQPHSSCDSEPTRQSRQGEARADLTVVNNTDATFQLHWLDYEGGRVRYEDAPPHTSRIQPTWLTHPWILTDAQGTCYVLIVMNAVQQTMTIGTTTGEIPATPLESARARPPGATTTSEKPDDRPGFPTPLVIGALVMMGVLVGLLAARGKLFPRSKS